jgi:hypothetical protein
VTTTDIGLLATARHAIADPGSILPRKDGETVPNWSARAVLSALEASEVMADVEDALDFVIEISPHDTSRFRRAREVLFGCRTQEPDRG